MSAKTYISGDTKINLLEKLLDSSKKNRIKSIGERYGVRLTDKNTKQQMIAAVLPAIEANFGAKLKRYDASELKLAMDCLTEQPISEQTADAVMHSAPFLDGAVYVIDRKEGLYAAVPHELAGKLMMRCVTQCFDRDENPLAASAAACTALYGAFTPRMLAEAANNAYGGEITPQQAEEYLASTESPLFTYHDGMAASARSFEIRAEAAETEYYCPSQAELESYATYGADTSDYYYRQIVNFIFNNAGIPYDKAKILTREIADLCADDASRIVTVVEKLNESGLLMTDDQLNYLFDMISELSNRTRKPSLKGHRPDEIEGMQPAVAPRIRIDRAKPSPVRAEEKIGRNDPCPCGSGKKYKKCCGKNK